MRTSVLSVTGIFFLYVYNYMVSSGKYPSGGKSGQYFTVHENLTLQAVAYRGLVMPRANTLTVCPLPRDSNIGPDVVKCNKGEQFTCMQSSHAGLKKS